MGTGEGLGAKLLSVMLRMGPRVTPAACGGEANPNKDQSLEAAHRTVKAAAGAAVQFQQSVNQPKHAA